MTLYEAWSRGFKWVVWQDRLWRLSAPHEAVGKFFLSHNGSWRRRDCLYTEMVSMQEHCEPVSGKWVQSRRRKLDGRSA